MQSGDAKPISKFYENNDSYQGAGHPAYGFVEYGDKTVYLDITHAPVVKDKHNPAKIYGYKKLSKNPNPHDIENSYISPFPYSTKTVNLRNENKNWQFDKNDLVKIEKYKNKDIH